MPITPRPASSRVTTADGRSPGSRVVTSTSPSRDRDFPVAFDARFAAYSCGGSCGLRSRPLRDASGTAFPFEPRSRGTVAITVGVRTHQSQSGARRSPGDNALARIAGGRTRFAGRLARNARLAAIPTAVVPAHAGTHNHRRSCGEGRRSRPFPPTHITRYGSLRAQGRRRSVRRESLSTRIRGPLTSRPCCAPSRIAACAGRCRATGGRSRVPRA